MGNKKSSGGLAAKGTTPRSLLDHRQIMDILQALQQKVLASAVLNGGFDTMLFQVNKIEEGQVKMGEKVDSIHDAIYRPDDGLFARVKDVELVKEKIDSVEQLERDVASLQIRAESEEKLVEKETKATEENEKLVKAHAEQLKDLIAFKTRICAIAKWTMVTMAGGLATLIGKLIYDFLSGHITVH